MKRQNLLLFTFLCWQGHALALEPYQGEDYKVESWRCGAPLVESLRRSDPDELLKDPAGRLMLKESLEKISLSNLTYLKKKLGSLNVEEKKLLELIQEKYRPAIVHRTNLESSKVILQNNGMVSATKRDAKARYTPNIEQELFSGRDCIFTSVAPPYGTQDYGTTIFRFKDKEGFAWGSIYTGFSWTKEVAKRSITEPATEWMKTRFARQIFTNNHWDEALALHIILHIRNGTSIRDKGQPYDKKTLLSELLNIKSGSAFWKKVVAHRLAYLEGKYTDNVPNEDFLFVQFRTLDSGAVRGWNFPQSWFDGGHDSFIQFFDRSL